MPFNDWGQLRGNSTAGWNALINEPKLASGQGQTGFVYRVIVAGSTEIDGETVWNVGDFIYFNGDTWQRITNGSGSGVETFLQLTDTPSTYAGSAGLAVTVNGTEDGLEFTAITGGVDTFLELTDTPATYAGAALQFVQVNAGETALTFVDNATSIPGGTTGQVLTKDSNTDDDYSWQDAASTPTPIIINSEVEDTLIDDEIVGRHICVAAFSIPSGGTGSYSKSDVAATAQTILTLRKNGVSFGTITYAAAGLEGTFAIASTTSFAVGDVYTVTGPATADLTLGFLAVTILATRL